MKAAFGLMLALISAPALSAPEATLISKDWAVMCEEDVFDETNPFECFLVTSGTSKMILGIERGPLNNLKMRLIEKSIEDEAASKVMSEIDIGAFLKIDKGDLIKSTAKYTRRNSTHSQITPAINGDEFKKLISEMKNGSSLNLKLNVIGNEFIDKFSLSGFTRAYNYMLDKDSRRPAQNSSKSDGKAHSDSDAITLKDGTAIDWQNADEHLRLIAAKKIIQQFLDASVFNGNAQKQAETDAGITRLSSELKDALNAAFEKDPSADKNNSLHANQNVLEFSVVIASQMGWM